MTPLQARLDNPAYSPVVQSLREVGFGSMYDLLSTYAGQDQDLKPWLRDAEINRDGNLRLQYLAGLALNISQEGYIYSEMLKYRQFPVNLFAGSEEKMQRLMTALSTTTSR